MAKPNYQFEKRQRDIANKKKQDEKRARKQAKNEPAASDAAATPEAARPARPERRRTELFPLAGHDRQALPKENPSAPAALTGSKPNPDYATPQG